MCPRVRAHSTRPLWAPGRGGQARFGSSVVAWHLSKYGGWAGRDGSTRPHPESPKPSRHAATPARSSDRATFFSRIVRIGTRDPVFRPLPIGLQPLEGAADRFITQQALRHALLIAHFRRQSQRPHPRGLAIEARRLMQEMLEAVTVGGIQHGRDGLRRDSTASPSPPRPGC